MLGKLPRKIRKKVAEFEEAGMGYWLVTARLRDGRVFGNVYITDLFSLGFPDLCPFAPTDITDVEPEGPRGHAAEALIR